MYAVRNGPNKFNTKANRRGPIHPLDRVEGGRSDTHRGDSRRGDWPQQQAPPPPPHQQHQPAYQTDPSSQKYVFNGNRKSYGGRPSQPNSSSSSGSSNGMMIPVAEPTWPQYEENVRFISETWQRFHEGYEYSLRKGHVGGPEQYQEKNPIRIEGFEPFDLEQWWGNRTLMNI